LGSLPVRASWFVQASAGAVQYGGVNARQGPFPTQQAANDFIRTCGYQATLIPGGSNDTTSSSSSSGGPGFSVPSSVQQMQMQMAAQVGFAVGKSIGNALFGNHEPSAAQLQQQQAQQQVQQSQLAAQQLNNSGLYLLRQKKYAGAINEFQQALATTPNDQSIGNNLRLAKQQFAKSLSDIAAAGQTSTALSQLLGPPSAGSAASALIGSQSPLNLVNLDSDPNVVDLRGTTKTSVDPSLLNSGSSPVVTDQSMTQQEMDAQFDNLVAKTDPVKQQVQQKLDDEFDQLYNKAAAPEKTAYQHEADAQFDELSKKADAEESQKMAERREADAEFDKLYNASATPPAVTAGNSPQPASQLPSSQVQVAQIQQTNKAIDNVFDQQFDETIRQGVKFISVAPDPTMAQAKIVDSDEQLKDAVADNTGDKKLFETKQGMKDALTTSVHAEDAQKMLAGYSSDGTFNRDLKGAMEQVKAETEQKFDTPVANAGHIDTIVVAGPDAQSPAQKVAVPDSLKNDPDFGKLVIIRAAYQHQSDALETRIQSIKADPAYAQDPKKLTDLDHLQSAQNGVQGMADYHDKAIKEAIKTGTITFGLEDFGEGPAPPTRHLDDGPGPPPPGQ